MDCLIATTDNDDVILDLGSGETGFDCVLVCIAASMLSKMVLIPHYRLSEGKRLEIAKLCL